MRVCFRSLSSSACVAGDLLSDNLFYTLEAMLLCDSLRSSGTVVYGYLCGLMTANAITIEPR